MGDDCVDAYKSLNKEFFGEDSLNVAVHCARLGVHSAYVEAIGDDQKFIKDYIKETHAKVITYQGVW
jgi:sugar/nucleoside kinase (ribokinase family)